VTGSTPSCGTFPPELVQRVVRTHISEIRRCYERAMTELSPSTAGRVTIEWDIAPDGHVASARVAETAIEPSAPSLEQCMVDAIRRLQFPAPEGGGTVRVRYPFNLRTE
jgi:TonB family protein